MDRTIVRTVADQTRVVSNAPMGPPGVQGPVGPPGPPGESSGTAAKYVHTQNTAALIWTVQHGIGFNPGGVVVLDAGGVQYDPVVTYVNTATLLLTFHEPTSGTAYIS